MVKNISLVLSVIVLTISSQTMAKPGGKNKSRNWSKRDSSIRRQQTDTTPVAPREPALTREERDAQARNQFESLPADARLAQLNLTLAQLSIFEQRRTGGSSS